MTQKPDSSPLEGAKFLQRIQHLQRLKAESQIVTTACILIVILPMAAFAFTSAILLALRWFGAP